MDQDNQTYHSLSAGVFGANAGPLDDQFLLTKLHAVQSLNGLLTARTDGSSQACYTELCPHETIDKSTLMISEVWKFKKNSLELYILNLIF